MDRVPPQQDRDGEASIATRAKAEVQVLYWVPRCWLSPA